MPTLNLHSDGDVAPPPSVREHREVSMVGPLDREPQLTPIPFGPESAELNRIMVNVRRSLAQLETIQPYLEQFLSPHLALLSRVGQSAEAELDYQRLPSARTVTTNTRFFVRGRGKPKPYPLEDG